MTRPTLATFLCALVLSCGGASPATTAPPTDPVATPGATAVTASTTPGVTASPAITPASSGAAGRVNLPPELLGIYRDAGETSVVWTFLAAGDPYCVETVATLTTCMNIERTNLGTIVDYGPVTLVSANVLELTLLFDEDEACLDMAIQIPFAQDSAGNLRLDTSGTCIQGAPRGQLIRV